MGWLQKIWSFFWEQNQVQPAPHMAAGQKVAVHFHDVEEWLDRQRQGVIVNHKLESDVITYTNKLKAMRWELECKVDEWQNSIPLGRGDEFNPFFVQTRKLLDIIEFPEELTVKGVMDLQRSVAPAASSLMREIEQSAFATDFSFIFGEQAHQDQVHQDQQAQVQVNPLLQELAELKEASELFDQKVTRAGMKTIEHLYRKKGQLDELLEQRKKLQKKIKLMKDRLDTAEAMKEEKEEELQELQKNPLYQSVGELEKQRADLRRQLEENEDAVVAFFSKMKPLLQKYKDLQASTLVDSYVEDALSAFLVDDGLSILHVLDHLQAALQQERLNMGVEETNAYYEYLGKARKGYLAELHQKNLQLQKELEGTSVPLRNRDFVMKIEEARYRVEHFTKKLSELGDKLFGLEEELEQTDETITREQHLLQDMAKIGLGQELEVVFPV